MGVYERVAVDFFLIIKLKASGNMNEKRGVGGWGQNGT
jgi:hypothetical protein